jgi:hypothetical protein
MSIRNVESERFSLTSKPFETVVNAVNATGGRLDLVEFAKTPNSAVSFSELEKVGDEIRAQQV